jgi:hypothetical protein
MSRRKWVYLLALILCGIATGVATVLLAGWLSSLDMLR